MTTDFTFTFTLHPILHIGQHVYAGNSYVHYTIKGFSIDGLKAFLKLEHSDCLTSVPVEYLTPIPSARQIFDPAHAEGLTAEVTNGE
jgi:hypothetical protein